MVNYKLQLYYFFNKFLIIIENFTHEYSLFTSFSLSLSHFQLFPCSLCSSQTRVHPLHCTCYGHIYVYGMFAHFTESICCSLCVLGFSADHFSLGSLPGHFLVKKTNKLLFSSLQPLTAYNPSAEDGALSALPHYVKIIFSLFLD